jgi:uncharacterized phage protein (TIGR01671 family)
MREIKFRGWHTSAQKMLYEDRIGDVLCWKEQGQPLEVMQYTGLKDKNGKEIYEGDIIRIGHPYKGRTYTGEIVYERYFFTAKDFYFTHHDNPGDPFESLAYIEVIGNIYENPELLGEIKSE